MIVMDYEKLLYEYYNGSECNEDEIDKEVQILLKTTDDPEVLHAFALEHNYDDGIDIPEIIAANPACDLATALTIFYDIEAYDYLMYGKDSEIYEKESFELFKIIRDNVHNEFYSRSGKIPFKVPLSKIQVYKMKKDGLKKKDYIFIEDIITN